MKMGGNDLGSSNSPAPVASNESNPIPPTTQEDEDDKFQRSNLTGNEVGKSRILDCQELKMDDC